MKLGWCLAALAAAACLVPAPSRALALSVKRTLTLESAKTSGARLARAGAHDVARPPLADEAAIVSCKTITTIAAVSNDGATMPSP
jgi:hypothetical protein